VGPKIRDEVGPEIVRVQDGVETPVGDLLDLVLGVEPLLLLVDPLAD
jgi:hypothetical protein